MSGNWHDQIAEINEKRNWSVILSGESGLSHEQHRARLLGASDVEAILCVSPYRGPLDVYLDFFGLRPPRPATDRMRRGLALEPYVARCYAEQTGRVLYKPVSHSQPHPELPILTVHADRIVRDPPVNVQLKVVGWTMEPQWSAGAPAYVVAQVHAEMMAWALPVTDVAADINERFQIHTVEFDPEVATIILEQVEKFWNEHIWPMRMPEGEPGSKTARDALLARYPKIIGKIERATPEVQTLADRLRHANEELWRAQGAVDYCREEFMTLIGEAKGFKGDDWKTQWFEQKGRAKIDWRGLQRALVERGLVKGAVIEELVKEHTTVGAPGRQFRFDDRQAKNGEEADE